MQKKTHRNRTQGLVRDDSNEFHRFSVSLCRFDCHVYDDGYRPLCVFRLQPNTVQPCNRVGQDTQPSGSSQQGLSPFLQGSFVKYSPMFVGDAHLSAVPKPNSHSLKGSQNFLKICLVENEIIRWYG